MMRNSINSYLTTLVMVLALLLSANAFAANTVRSTITIDDNEYTLYTGFNAIEGTNVSSSFVFSNMVDGDLTTQWRPRPIESEDYSSKDYAYFEFSSDYPVILKGYILNSHSDNVKHPTDRRLYAKANEEDTYELVSSYKDEDYSGKEKIFPVDNEDNNQYRYFRFEGTNSDKDVWLQEIRLYGEKTYSFVPKKSATCTETGIKQVCYLRSDGRYFTDETGAIELAESDFIEPMKPHTCVHHVADEIHVEYWQCSVCGKYFSDEGCVTEIAEEKTKIYRTVSIDDGVSSLVSSNVSQAFAGATVTLTVSHLIDASTLNVNNGAVVLTDIGNRKYTFTMPATEVAVKASLASTYSVNLPDNMEIVDVTNAADGNGKYISGTIVSFMASFRYVATNVSDGTNTLEPGDDGVYTVTISTNDINIMASTTESDGTLYLAAAKSDFIAVDGNILSGETNHTIHIADGATITLSGAIINGGIICDGSATITLVGENNVTGATNMAGIQVGGLGTTLTIRGDGSLTATGNYSSAGIGLSYALDGDALGGDIVIESGNITAIGYSQCGSGIGTGAVSHATARLGNITIKGGVVKTIGGFDADGIGVGCVYTNESTNEVGTVTIYDDVDVVDASSIKNAESIIYMHDDIDVSVSKNDYFGIIENGKRKIIYTGIPAFDVEDQTYTGETITPKPTVSLGSLNFEEGTDYEYSYSNNVNVGISATVTITFKGDYAELGSVSKTFEITKATPTVEPPTSANPKYAGACVALVASGSSNSGDMLYSVLREGGSQTAYSTDIPCADWAGRYTVYYKVEESDNWFGFAPQSVDVTVENEMFKITFVDDEGDEIISREYEYGTPAEGVDLPPENPEKADDEMYAYTFAGWSPEIQDVTGAMTYSPIYDKTRIGFGPITIAKDSSLAIIDGMSRDPIDKAIKDCMIKGEVTLYRHFAAGKYSTLVLPFSTFTGAFSGVSFYSFRGVEKENGVWKTVVFGYVDKENEGNKHIEANTPYIVVADADIDDLVVKDGVLFNADDPKSSYGATLTCSEETCDEVPDENKSWQFVGTYNYRQWDSGNNVEEIGTTYGFAGAAGNGGMEIGKFGKIKEGAYIYPMRAYLRYQPPSPPSVLFKAAPAYASVASIDELPESMDVVIRGEEGTTVIGTINTRTGEFRSADNRWFDLNGRYLGNKKPTIKGTYYNNGKKVIVR